MSDTTAPLIHKQSFLPKDAMNALVRRLVDEGYTVIGPQVHDGAIMMRPLTTADELAKGVCDEQDGGRYRLTDGDSEMYFDNVVGPDSPKRYFFPPQQKLFTLTIKGERFQVDDTTPKPPKYAFIGIRACELAAIKIQDRVFGIDVDQQTFRCESDQYYRRARQNALFIVVNCTRPAGTCFCVSMETGPEAIDSFDLSLTELREGFIVRTGTEKGVALLGQLPAREATSAELELASMKLRRARDQMGRRLDTRGLKEALDKSMEHPRWDEVADRCLSCANCTMVCPTCFCSTVSDTNDLATGQVTRTRFWESCFTHQFSYTTTGPVRSTIRGRYRHWLCHKLATWWDQFDTSGCVGCGRCITWCPVGIDLTEEATAIREQQTEASDRSGRGFVDEWAE